MKKMRSGIALSLNPKRQTLAQVPGGCARVLKFNMIACVATLILGYPRERHQWKYATEPTYFTIKRIIFEE